MENTAEELQQHRSAQELQPLKEFLPALCDQYSQYLQIPTKAIQQQQTVEDTIESMLTRLDEFQALVDTVRADTSQLDLNLLPQLKKQVPQLLRVFMLIQHLEEFISKMKVVVHQMESRMDTAESAYNAIARSKAVAESPLKFFGLGSDRQEMPHWEAVEFLDLDSFFSGFKDLAMNSASELGNEEEEGDKQHSLS